MGVYCTTATRPRGSSERWQATGKKLDMGKSCVRFKKLDDLPLDVVGEAIARTSVDDFIGWLRAVPRPEVGGAPPSRRGQPMASTEPRRRCCTVTPRPVHARCRVPSTVGRTAPAGVVRARRSEETGGGWHREVVQRGEGLRLHHARRRAATTFSSTFPRSRARGTAASRRGSGSSSRPSRGERVCRRRTSRRSSDPDRRPTRPRSRRGRIRGPRLPPSPVDPIGRWSVRAPSSSPSSSCRTGGGTATRRSPRTHRGPLPRPANSPFGRVTTATATRPGGHRTRTSRRCRGWCGPTSSRVATSSTSRPGITTTTRPRTPPSAVLDGEMPPVATRSSIPTPG